MIRSGGIHEPRPGIYDAHGWNAVGSAHDPDLKIMVDKVFYQGHHGKVIAFGVGHSVESHDGVVHESAGIGIIFLNGHALVCLRDGGRKDLLGTIGHLAVLHALFHFQGDLFKIFRRFPAVIVKHTVNEKGRVKISRVQLTVKCSVHIKDGNTVFHGNKLVRRLVGGSCDIILDVL